MPWWLAENLETGSVERRGKGPDALQVRFGNEIMGTAESRPRVTPGSLRVPACCQVMHVA